MKKITYFISILVVIFLISTIVFSHSESKKNYTSLAVESTGRVFAINEGNDGIDIIDPTGSVMSTLLRHKGIKAVALDEKKKNTSCCK